jgi:hypothetical protein
MSLQDLRWSKQATSWNEGLWYHWKGRCHWSGILFRGMEWLMRGYELGALNRSLTTLLTLKLHVHTFQCHIPPLHHSLRLVISLKFQTWNTTPLLASLCSKTLFSKWSLVRNRAFRVFHPKVSSHWPVIMTVFNPKIDYEVCCTVHKRCQPWSCISIPFQIQRRCRSSLPIRRNRTADTLRVATLCSLNYMLSMLYLNLKPGLDIDDFGDLYHSMLHLKLMMHQ